MYLSRVRIDTELRSSRKALADPNTLHAMVAGCFDGCEDRQRPLWRIDTLGGSTYLVIASQAAPGFEKLLPQLSSAGSADAAVKEYGAYLQSIRDGELLRFRVTANPVYSRKAADSQSSRGKVYGHVTVEQQKEWLRQRAGANGFTLEDFEGVSRGVKTFHRQGKKVTLAVATFEGLLRVTDADLLRGMLSNGLGRAKAYGCGMMTVARL